MFNACKTLKLACACTVACDFGMCTRVSEYTQQMRDVRHKILQHYTCGVTTGTVAVGNEIQLYCS